MTEFKNQAPRILEAAYECLLARGYAAVSLREIAARAGVALSQLHYYYRSKTGLFREVIRMVRERYRQEVEQELVRGDSPQEKLARLTDFFREKLSRDPHWFRLFFDLANLEAWNKTLHRQIQGFFRDLTDLLEKHVFNSEEARQRLKGHSPQSLARLLVGSLYGLALQGMVDPQDANIAEALSGLKMVFVT